MAKALSHSIPFQKPPVQSPAGEQVQLPVAGSAKCGKPAGALSAVRITRPRMRSRAARQGAGIAQRRSSVGSRGCGTVKSINRTVQPSLLK